MGREIYSFDTLRTVAVFFVVTIHTSPFNGLGLIGNAIDFTIDTTARFAVPLFFLVAGYLFSMNLRRKAQEYIRIYLRRVAAIYAFGIILVLPIRLLVKTGSVMLKDGALKPALITFILQMFSPMGFFYYGSSIGYHLWFLPALGYSIFFIYLAQRQGWIVHLLIFATVLHGIGMTAEAYNFVTNFSFNARDALFFGLFYTTAGYWLEQQSYSIQDANSRVILSLVAVLGLLHLIERYVLGYVLGLASGSLSETVFAANYSLLTPFFAISVFLFALSTPNFGEGSYLQRLGKLTVGIYVLHVPVLTLFRIAAALTSKLTVYTPSDTVIWHVVLTPAVCILTLFSYIILGRLGIVSHFYHYRSMS